MSHALLEHAPAPDQQQPDVPHDAGGPENPNYDYLGTMPTPDTSHSVADSYVLGDVDDVQLREEDGLVRGEDGKLHSAHTPMPSQLAELPSASPGGANSAAGAHGFESWRTEVTPLRAHRIDVRDIGAGPTSLHVSIGQPARGTASVPGKLYGGRLVGESHRPAHRR